MRKNTSGHEASRGTESLEDLVYRSQIATGNAKVRNANPLITIPFTLLGYLALGFLGWRLVLHSRTLVKESPKSVVVDLQDLSIGDAPQAAAPPPPPAAGGPPPGAIEKADAPPPPIPVSPDTVPDKPPAELPTQDLSGVAVPTAATGGPGGTGVGSGPGAGGTATGVSPESQGSGMRTVQREYKSLKIKYEPPKPPYPLVAKTARIQGTVLVEITVGVDGVPISAKAVEGPLMLRKTAEAQAMKYRYEPALENGEPVIATATFTMTFALTGP